MIEDSSSVYFLDDLRFKMLATADAARLKFDLVPVIFTQAQCCVGINRQSLIVLLKVG